MSIEQTVAAAKAAGFTGDALETIVAIAGRESRWDPNAVGDKDNPRKGCGSYGLVQINSCPTGYGAGHPRYADNPRALLDPNTNLRAAFTISKGGTDFGPWTTYRAGIPSADPFREQARAAIAGAGGSASSTTGAGGTSADGVQSESQSGIGGLLSFVGRLADPNAYKRTFMVYLGIVTCGVALAIILYDQSMPIIDKAI